jgi:hypothetical protein
MPSFAARGAIAVLSPDGRVVATLSAGLTMLLLPPPSWALARYRWRSESMR